MRPLLATLAVTALVGSIGTASGERGVVARERAIRPGGINVEPGMRPWRYGGANPDGWWCRPRACNGVANGTVFVDRELKLISKLGAKRLRLEFPWPLIEPSRNVFDWRRADYIVKRAHRYRVALLPILLYTPEWEARHPTDPPRPGSYSAFVAAFAHRYRASIEAYELWNEPDLERYWTGTPQQYVEKILRPGARAVMAQDPHARVVLGGPATANLEWLNQVYRFGGGTSFDVMSFHDYSGDSQILTDARLVLDVLRAHGQARKPIWLGEYGIQERSGDDRCPPAGTASAGPHCQGPDRPCVVVQPARRQRYELLSTGDDQGGDLRPHDQRLPDEGGLPDDETAPGAVKEVHRSVIGPAAPALTSLPRPHPVRATKPGPRARLAPPWSWRA